jgi:Tfp pilus assembly protein PilX
MRTLKNKRGAALVSAVAFMLVMAILGLLLTAAISYAHLQVRSNQTVENAWLAREELGEYFVRANEPEFNAVLEKTNYTAEINYSTTEKTEKKEKTLLLRNARGNVILYIKASFDSKKSAWQPTVWRYSEPTD